MNIIPILSGTAGGDLPIKGKLHVIKKYKDDIKSLHFPVKLFYLASFRCACDECEEEKE